MIPTPQNVPRFYWVVMLLFAALALPPAAFSEPPVSPDNILLEWRDAEFVFKTDQARLEDIIREVGRRGNVTIDGLDPRGSETVSFEFRGLRMEESFRRFMRQLNVRNYAFEYLDNELIRVSVLAEGSATPPAAGAANQGAAAVRGAMAHVVEIQEVLPDSQAELLSMMVGDLIVAYDNKGIAMPQELVRMVTEKPGWEKVDLLVLRNGEPVRYVVNGGLIGIRIKTAEFPREELEKILKTE